MGFQHFVLTEYFFIFLWLRKYFTITALCCITVWQLTAQQVRFIRYGMKEGLSNEMVNCLFKDSRGFLWIGTDFGLNRFDGVRFEKWFHKPGDSTSLLSNKINSIAEDRQQRLWLGTDGGVSVYDIRSGKFSSYAEIRAGNTFIGNLSQVKTFCDREGDVWIGSSNGHVFLYKHEVQKFEVIPLVLRPSTRLQNEFISGFLHDSRNRIWIGSSYGVYQVDKKTLSVTSFRFPPSQKGEASLNACTRLFETKGGLILCGTWNAGFIWYNEAAKAFAIQDKTEGNFLPSPVVFDFAQQDSLIYFAGISGLFTCSEKNLADPSFSGYTSHVSVPNDPFSLGSNENSSVINGVDGTVWVGGANGLSQLNVNSRFYHFYTYDKLVNLPEWPPVSITQQYGELYMVVEHEVLGFNLEKNSFHKILVDIRGKKRHGLYKDGDGFFLPGQTGLYLYDPHFKLKRSVTEKLPNGAVANMICALHDRQGNLWIGTTRYGIRKISAVDGSVTKYLHDSAGLNSLGYYMNSIMETGSGTIYAGGRQLYVYNSKTNRFALPVSSDSTVSVTNVLKLKAQGHRIWIGTMNGLFEYDEQLKKMTAHPFPSHVNQVINELETDVEGNIWMISFSGMLKYSPVDKSILVFNSQNGWPGNFSVLRKLQDGRMAVGINGGILLFNPADVKKQTYSPPPQITGLIVDEKQVHHLPGSDSLFTIEYKQGIRFNYISLTYLNAEANQYQWKLEGFDEKWHPAGNQTTQAFTSLSPGVYTFLVRSANAAGEWSKEYASVKFRVMPPFYLSWWFIAAVLLFLVLAGYALYRYRLNQALALEKLRTRIATDLHDDIGATLSSISFYSEAVRKKIKDKLPETEPILEKMGETSRSMVGNMSDIVWAINPVNDAAGSLFKRMHDYAAELCQLKNVQLDFEPGAGLDKRSLDIESRKNIYLIFKEAVNNAMKYSGCSLLAVKIEAGQKRLQVSVKDNGKGFDTGQATGGNGLLNMVKRAGELGGTLQIISAANKGTSIELTCPIP